ncbi:MAG: sulfotransferase family 2 domain-containing protein [Hyphomicrobiaceae bacterium]
MILSHAHRFIYIKTYKTASTSIEAALSEVCGPDDVITEASEQLRGARKQRAAQNYRLDHPAVPKRALWKKLLGRPERYYHPSIGYYEHMPAWRVRTYVGEDIWRRYYKFSFERNPWDRQVSWYHYKTKSKTDKPSFDAFNRDRKRAYVENFDLYTEDGKITLDFVGRYEDLDAGFAKVLSAIGLKGRVTLPRTNVSKVKEVDYRSFYTAESQAIIGSWYQREIAHFGYEF